MVQLPDEVLLLIVQSLPDLSELLRDTSGSRSEDGGPTTRLLTNLCLVSKIFRSFAQPLLYRAFINDEDEKCRKQLHRFLRTCIERPDLATQVHYLEFPDHTYRECACTSDQSLNGLMLEASDRLPSIYASSPKVHSRPAQRSRAWRRKWQESLAKEDSESRSGEIVLLLTLVPNLKHLYLHTSYYRESLEGLCQDIIEVDSERFQTQHDRGCMTQATRSGEQSLYRSTHVLSRLETLFLEDMNGSNTDIRPLTRLVTIPSLKSLILYGRVQQQFEPNGICTTPLPNLEELRLGECCLGTVGLQSLIMFCQKLQTLYVSYDDFSDGSEVVMEDVMASLSKKSETLRQLHLTFTTQCRDQIILAERSNLKHFTNLECLETNMDLLFDPEDNAAPSFAAILPLSLEVLYLRMVDKRFTRHLDVLAEQCKKFQRLKLIKIAVDERIQIHDMDAQDVAWKITLDNCVRMIRKAGIEVDVPIEGTRYSLACGE